MPNLKRTRQRLAHIVARAGQILLLLVVAAIVVAGLAHLVIKADAPVKEPSSTTSTTTKPHVIDNPLLPDDDVQGYWYCWNSGAAAPHHLDHWVTNDHLCTWGELRFSGVTQ
ncbi:hypothetical protein ACFWXK_14340 [Streptomyces sp. NPDC059070]|uniref:hypothetical protein n=1 Tax=Streptomyces sp. NPDC059070 TaxID=3346713 RepID=UPI0036C3D251